MKPFFTLKSLAMSHTCVTTTNQGSLKLGEFTIILDSEHFTSSINNGEVVVSTSNLGSSCSCQRRYRIHMRQSATKWSSRRQKLDSWNWHKTMIGPKLICMIAWSQVANLQRITPISHHQMCHLTSDPKFNSLTFHNSLFVFMLKLAPKFCLPLKHFSRCILH